MCALVDLVEASFPGGAELNAFPLRVEMRKHTISERGALVAMPSDGPSAAYALRADLGSVRMGQVCSWNNDATLSSEHFYRTACLAAVRAGTAAVFGLFPHADVERLEAGVLRERRRQGKKSVPIRLDDEGRMMVVCLRGDEADDVLRCVDGSVSAFPFLRLLVFVPLAADQPTWKAWRTAWLGGAAQAPPARPREGCAPRAARPAPPDSNSDPGPNPDPDRDPDPDRHSRVGEAAASRPAKDPARAPEQSEALRDAYEPPPPPSSSPSSSPPPTTPTTPTTATLPPLREMAAAAPRRASAGRGADESPVPRRAKRSRAAKGATPPVAPGSQAAPRIGDGLQPAPRAAALVVPKKRRRRDAAAAERAAETEMLAQADAQQREDEWRREQERLPPPGFRFNRALRSAARRSRGKASFPASPVRSEVLFDQAAPPTKLLSPFVCYLRSPLPPGSLVALRGALAKAHGYGFVMAAELRRCVWMLFREGEAFRKVLRSGIDVNGRVVEAASARDKSNDPLELSMLLAEVFLEAEFSMAEGAGPPRTFVAMLEKDGRAILRREARSREDAVALLLRALLKGRNGVLAERVDDAVLLEELQAALDEGRLGLPR